MKEPLNVLSIDWDYFQNTNLNILHHYPDGIDHSTELSELIWSCKYEIYPYLKNDITLMETEYNNLRHILGKQASTCPVMIANSHVHAFDFIQENKKDKINITNIDMHHDIINENPERDCGNWLKELLMKKAKLKWISNPISFDMYKIQKDKDLLHAINSIHAGTSLDVIKNESYDIIFLARSDTWSPPHLDKYFCQLVNEMTNHFDKITIETSVKEPRKQILLN